MAQRFSESKNRKRQIHNAFAAHSFRDCNARCCTDRERGNGQALDETRGGGISHARYKQSVTRPLRMQLSLQARSQQFEHHSVCSDGRSPLHWAASEGHLQMSRTLLELNATVDQTDKSKSQRTCVIKNECENHDLIWLSVQWAKRHFTTPHQEGIWKSAIRCCNLEQIRILAISVCYGTRSHAHTVKQPPLQKQLDEGGNMQHSVTCYRRRRHAPVLGCNTWPF